MAFENDKSEKPWKTIDRDRKITLTNTGVDKEGTWYFDLDVSGKNYRFEAFRGDENIGKGKGFNIIWKVMNIYSEHKINQRVKDIIKESLETFGTIYRTDNVASLKVEFLV